MERGLGKRNEVFERSHDSASNVERESEDATSFCHVTFSGKAHPPRMSTSGSLLILRFRTKLQ